MVSMVTLFSLLSSWACCALVSHAFALSPYALIAGKLLTLEYENIIEEIKKANTTLGDTEKVLKTAFSISLTTKHLQQAEKQFEKEKLLESTGKGRK